MGSVPMDTANGEQLIMFFYITCGPNISLECLFEQLHQGIEANVMLLQKGSHCSGKYKCESSLPDAQCLFAVLSTDKASTRILTIKGDLGQQPRVQKTATQVVTGSEDVISKEKTIRLI